MASSKSRSNNRSSTTEKAEPIWTRKFWTGSGNLEISIWENTTGEGDEERTVLSTTLKKTYKKGNEYKESSSFFPAELPLAALALTEAARYCFDLSNKQ